jgi:hypothetical protein
MDEVSSSDDPESAPGLAPRSGSSSVERLALGLGLSGAGANSAVV